MYVLLSAEWALAGVTLGLATGSRPQRGMGPVRGRRLILFVLYVVSNLLCLQTKIDSHLTEQSSYILSSLVFFWRS